MGYTVISRNVPIEEILQFLNKDKWPGEWRVHDLKNLYPLIRIDLCGNCFYIYTDQSAKAHSGIDGFLVETGKSPIISPIYKALVEHFGGYISEVAVGSPTVYKPVNLEKFFEYENKTKSKIEILKDRISSELGVDKLAKCLEILKFYKNEVLIPQINECFDDEISSTVYDEGDGEFFSEVTGKSNFINKLRNGEI